MAPNSPKRPHSPTRSGATPPHKKWRKDGNAPTPPSVGRSQSPPRSASGSPKKKAKQRAIMNTTTGVMDYLQKAVSRPEMLGLYNDVERGQFACRAVLQQLPETTQQIVVRLSCTGGEFPVALVSSWFRTSSTSASAHFARLTKLLEQLYQWAILTEKPGSKSEDGNKKQSTEMVQLTPEFYQGLKRSLLSLDASPWKPINEAQMQLLVEEAIKVTGKSIITFPKMSPDDLERYTQTQWDAVLHYLVGTGNHPDPHPAVVQFLQRTKLMQPDPDYKGRNIDEAPLVITTKGYDFMLQDNAQQVWHFIVQYLASMEESLSTRPEEAQAMKREALLTLICLSFSRFGQCYAGGSLSKESRSVVRDMNLFGLVFHKKVGKNAIFYPTRIATQLIGSEGSGKKNRGGGGGMWSWSSKALESALAHPRPHDSSHLAIIVQTNFQLCAYTTSELHVSMLGLFCDVGTIRRLPNVIFMTISRDSIKGAFNLGIQAQQILRFLEKHAHPKLRESGTDPLPGNVVDQIYLWDRERHRVRWNEVFIHQPTMPGEFHAVQKYTMDKGAHAWSNEGRNQIMIIYAYVERVQRFIQKWRVQKAAGRI